MNNVMSLYFINVTNCSKLFNYLLFLVNQRTGLCTAAIFGAWGFCGKGAEACFWAEDIGIKCVKPQGAFREVADEDAAQKLLEKGVIVVPGTALGENGKGHIRISYAVLEGNLRRAIGVMEGVLG